MADDSGDRSSSSPDWPASGQLVTEDGGGGSSGEAAVYAHIGDPASDDVLGECRDGILQGRPPAGHDEITADDILDCKALLAAAEGRLAPGDYTHAELVRAVADGSEQ